MTELACSDYSHNGAQSFLADRGLYKECLDPLFEIPDTGHGSEMSSLAVAADSVLLCLAAWQNHLPFVFEGA